MKYYLKLSGILLLICVVASGTLAFVNKKTAPKIEKIAVEEKEAAMLFVLPETKKFSKQSFGDFTYFLAEDASGAVIGYVFVASGFGYSSYIKTVVGLKKDFTVNCIKVIHQAETPGLGARCVERKWQDQFDGKKLSQIAVKKDGGDIVSITGSTITSRAVANSISAGIRQLESAVVQKGGKK